MKLNWDGCMCSQCGIICYYAQLLRTCPAEVVAPIGLWLLYWGARNISRDFHCVMLGLICPCGRLEE